jgi:signal transduction histidine kinase
VADSGCGIEEKNLARLFQPFFTTKDIGLGTGLGLATSFKLIQSWGGNIRATSKPGEGATFHITLRAHA